MPDPATALRHLAAVHPLDPRHTRLVAAARRQLRRGRGTRALIVCAECLLAYALRRWAPTAQRLEFSHGVCLECFDGQAAKFGVQEEMRS